MSRCSARPSGRRRWASPTRPGSRRWPKASTAPSASSASSAASSSSASAISGPSGRWRWSQGMVAEPHPYVVGFGMGGDEAKFAPADFAPAYRLAHDKGYGCTVHAGEVRRAGKRLGRDQRPAGDPHRPRRALGRRSRADGGAGAPRHRPRGLPGQQRRPGAVSRPGLPSAASLDRRRRSPSRSTPTIRRSSTRRSATNTTRRVSAMRR